MFVADLIPQGCFVQTFCTDMPDVQRTLLIYLLLAQGQAQSRLSYFPLLYSPSRILQLENYISVKERRSPSMQKDNKGEFTQSIISITSALNGALVMSGFITTTQLFCSCSCLLLLVIFSALISGPFYIMPLTYYSLSWFFL